MTGLAIHNPATGECIATVAADDAASVAAKAGRARAAPRLLPAAGVGLTLSTCGIQTFTRTKAWHLRQP